MQAILANPLFATPNSCREALTNPSTEVPKVIERLTGQVLRYELSDQNLSAPFQFQIDLNRRVSPTVVPAIREILMGINQQLDTLGPPDQLNVKIVRTQGELRAFCYSEIQTIELAEHLVDEPAIFAHEYGHILFNSNFGRFWAPWNLQLKTWQAARDFYDKVLEPQLIELEGLQAQYDFINEGTSRWDWLLKPKKKKNKDLDAAKKLLEEAKSQVARSESHYRLLKMKNSKEVLRMDKLSVAYQELFADLVAVLYTGDPRAITDAILHNLDSPGPSREITPERSQLFATVGSRAFANNTATELIVKAWSHDSSLHGIFKPTRDFLNNNYLSDLNQRPSPAVLAEAVLKAIAEELLARHSNPFIGDDPKLLNQRLITAIERALPKERVDDRI